MQSQDENLLQLLSWPKDYACSTGHNAKQRTFVFISSTEGAKQKQSGLQYNSSLFIFFQTLQYIAYQKRGINTQRLCLRGLNFTKMHKFWAQDGSSHTGITSSHDRLFTLLLIYHTEILTAVVHVLYSWIISCCQNSQRGHCWDLYHHTIQNIGNKLFTPTIHFVTSS